jgi:hypothetical protein
MRKTIYVAALIAITVLVCPAVGRAQATCSEFQALVQWAAGPAPFSGPGYATFRGETLIDENAHWAEFTTETCNAGICLAKGGKLLLDFGNGDSLTLTLKHGVYTPSYMTLPGFGTWQTTLGIIGGTGRFVDASGVLTGGGPWTVWIDMLGFHGRFNGHWKGNLCSPSW